MYVIALANDSGIMWSGSEWVHDNVRLAIKFRTYDEAQIALRQLEAATQNSPYFERLAVYQIPNRNPLRGI